MTIKFNLAMEVTINANIIDVDHTHNRSTYGSQESTDHTKVSLPTANIKLDSNVEMDINEKEIMTCSDFAKDIAREYTEHVEDLKRDLEAVSKKIDTITKQ